MAVEPNGQEASGSERLSRIERALEFMLNDHILFREEHKQLMTAQVLLTGSLEKLASRVDALAVRVDKLSGVVETMREHFDMRLRRLEG